jgi:plasmid maintenance system antidote protein VapI
MHNPRQETINAIKFYEIPKTKLSRKIGVEASRISEYVRGKNLPTATTEKIESAVRDIVKVWTGLNIKTDLSDTEGFDRLLAYVNGGEAQS